MCFGVIDKISHTESHLFFSTSPPKYIHSSQGKLKNSADRRFH